MMPSLEKTMEKTFWNPLSFITLMSALLYIGWYIYKYSKYDAIQNNWLGLLSRSSSMSFAIVGFWGLLVLAFYYLF
jgi:hypothetical protein